MIGLVRKSTILSIFLLSATFAFAGDLKAVHEGGNNMHPAPQGSKETGMAHANENGLASVTKEKEDKEDKVTLRKLRPVK